MEGGGLDQNLRSVWRVESQEISIAILCLPFNKLDNVAILSPRIMPRKQGIVAEGALRQKGEFAVVDYSRSSTKS